MSFPFTPMQPSKENGPFVASTHPSSQPPSYAEVEQEETHMVEYMFNATCNIRVNSSRSSFPILQRHPIKPTCSSAVSVVLWSPTHVKLGSVVYFSWREGRLVTLCNVLDGLKLSNGMEVPPVPAPNYAVHELRKVDQASQFKAPLFANRMTARSFAHTTIYRHFLQLDPFKEWFNLYADDIVREFQAEHCINKDSLCLGEEHVVQGLYVSFSKLGLFILVTCALDASEYALVVSELHPVGHAQFNAFAFREPGMPWGAFTWCADPNHRADIHQQRKYTTKISEANTMGPRSLFEEQWDTLRLGGLKFEIGASEPTMTEECDG
ncbi:hypothetical protein F5I97DRAFT_1928228 [Phlebopus sp. FC_14]|nr:hypothetical protein F5I97DRAFT_1928228 [Phlebopus sp. FC_14]